MIISSDHLHKTGHRTLPRNLQSKQLGLELEHIFNQDYMSFNKSLSDEECMLSLDELFQKVNYPLY